MARPLRIEYSGAWYHVTSRGNERSEIFKDDKDRRRFLEALEESMDIFKVEVHCYVLMSNHFHFLLRTNEANLSRFMQRLNTAYTTYFNLRHHRTGHLYQGRYKAILVDADEYLLELSRYLHLNPVRLEKYKDTLLKEKCKILEAYAWSSLLGYAGLKKRDKFVTYGAVLDYMGGGTRDAKRRYREFVLQGIRKGAESVLEETRANTVLGGENFIKWVKEMFVEGKEWRHRDYPDVRAIKDAISVDVIAGVVGKDYGVRHEELLKVRSKWREARHVLIELTYRLNYRKKSLNELGKDLGGIGGDAISHNHAMIQAKEMKNKGLAKRIKELYGELVNQSSC